MIAQVLLTVVGGEGGSLIIPSVDVPGEAKQARDLRPRSLVRRALHPDRGPLTRFPGG